MSKKLVLGALGALAAVILPSVHAKPASLFTDNAVLQQGASVPVWGTDNPNIKITVDFAGQEKTTTADQNGNWRVTLDPLTANNQGQDLHINGSTAVTCRNVLVGEVWLCGGQSNMERPMTSIEHADDEIKSADFSSIRLFHAEHQAKDDPATSINGAWNVCTPKEVADFSAVGFLFARELHQKLNVPMGIIQSTWGGTTAESWTSAEALRADPQLKKLVDDYLSQPLALEDEAAAFRKADAERRVIIARHQPAPDVPTLNGKRDPDAWGPSRLFNGMIAPLIPYRISGVLWYQGESNTDALNSRTLGYQIGDTMTWFGTRIPDNAVTQTLGYQAVLSRLIVDWRNHWGQGDFPFLVVQLPNFSQRTDSAANTGWSLLREGQAKSVQSIPNTGLAVTIDISPDGDLHPPQKQPIAHRLALLAEAKKYGLNVPCQGPSFESMIIDGKTVTLKFKNLNGGLKMTGDKLLGFYVSDKDQNFLPAEAHITDAANGIVVLKTDSIDAPIAVRYAWGNNPACNLYNQADLPTVPFRTDDSNALGR